MSGTYTFYCVSGCSTCTKAKAWLSEHNIDFTYRDMIKEPLGADEVRALAQQGHMAIKDLVNRRSQVFKKINPALNDLNELAIIELLQEYPRLMLRPIISGPGTFISGFKDSEYAAKL